MATVAIERMTKRFADFTAVDALDLTIEEGSLVTLLGPSGCGKTTTLRCVAGLETPTEGTISIGARVVAKGARRLVPPNKRDLGMVFQSYALWPHMTVFANVAYPLRRAGLSGTELTARVSEIVDVIGLGTKLHSSIADLSGGQQQRVALARALVKRPKVLLCDEPLSNLDASLRRQMRNEIKRLHTETGTTCLYVTHDQEEAIALADRVVVMKDGTIVQDGPPQAIFTAPRTRFVAGFVGVENVLGTIEPAAVQDDVVKLHVGEGLVFAASRQRASGPAVACAFRADDVQLVAPGTRADNQFEAEVVSSVYVGVATELTVRVGAIGLTARLPARVVPPETAPRAGDRVTLAVAPSAVVALVDDEPAAAA